MNYLYLIIVLPFLYANSIAGQNAPPGAQLFSLLRLIGLFCCFLGNTPSSYILTSQQR